MSRKVCSVFGEEPCIRISGCCYNCVKKKICESPKKCFNMPSVCSCFLEPGESLSNKEKILKYALKSEEFENAVNGISPEEAEKIVFEISGTNGTKAKIRRLREIYE